MRARRERDLANLEDESAVHPDARGRGIGWHLLDLAEDWARERDLARLHVHVVNDEGRRLAEDRGHEIVRYFWRMEIALDDEPPEPEAPTASSFVDTAQVKTTKSCMPCSRMRSRSTGSSRPSRWTGGCAGVQAAATTTRCSGGLRSPTGRSSGAALAFGERHLGWVLDLAVSRAQRRHGLGDALLRSAFRALWQRGHTRVGLEVDSENETGATRLYERAGMAVTRRYATYEKRL